MKKSKTLFLVEVALFSALAYVFDLLANIVSLKIWAQGGSISIAMVPIFLVAFRWGLKGGLLSGLLLGGLQVVTGQAYIAHPVQGLLDYFLAFTVVGLAGIFAKQIQLAIQNQSKSKVTTYVIAGTLLGSGLRFLMHFIAGAVFFAEYAPEGTPVFVYSFLYNGTYMLPAFVLSAIFVSILINTAPKYFNVTSAKLNF
ncbi:energy-coupled thiamine transporter ThiT [Calidifontibacillus oryziterrae]|uniref:energy-coupled thiamine transporter ThiT n=1 Tax=Calidifontibacillus oryziterrae TaxID=1191699 RepID=UPI00031669A3|nr:energy-coupled thiamine transporter ThiT [Calidifontibacillus oryziterrae]